MKLSLDDWFEMSPYTRLLRENLEANLRAYDIFGNQSQVDEFHDLMRVNLIVIRQCIEDMHSRKDSK